MCLIDRYHIAPNAEREAIGIVKVHAVITLNFSSILLIFLLLLSGWGETFRGVKKDTTRVAKGVKTIFVAA